MLARATLLVMTCLMAAACSSGTTASPSDSASTSGAPTAALSSTVSPDASVPTVDEEFCGTIADLESALQSFEAIKIKAGNSSKLQDASNGVKAALAPITTAALPTLQPKVDALKLAVDGLNSSTENYATVSDKTAGEKKLKKSLTTLHTAITQLRSAATCTN